jgi:hypothetical protein
MKLRIDAFTGMTPKISPDKLPPSAAQVASNVKLTSGALKPVNSPKQESSSIVALATSVYMIGAPGSSVPLSWTADVDVAASPTADSEYRIYYTGDGVPKKTNQSMAGAPSGGPLSWYNMGVPGPASAATATPSTASGAVPAGTYVYCYTYVTQFGTTLLEESAPSPSVTATLGATGNIALTGLANPASTTNYNFQYKRIYRSTGTSFQMVAQVSVATTSYTDSLSPSAIAGDALITTGWIPPPSDLKGIAALPSGVLAGFRGNEVWFCEPGYPHAWPAAYSQTFDTQIVGLKVYGNNIVLATQGFPYQGGGVHPDAFTFQKMPFLEPCLSKRSMAADEFGVLYASSNGLVAIGMEANGVISAPYLARDTFSQYAPDTFTACVFERRYYGFYTDTAGAKGAFVYTRGEPAPISTLTRGANAVHIDAKTARMLFIDTDTGYLNRFDPPDTIQDNYIWKSKLVEMAQPLNFGCFRVIGSEQSASDAASEADRAAKNAVITAANSAAFTSGVLMSEFNSAPINTYAINGSAMANLIPAIAQTVGVTIFAGRSPAISGTFSLNTIYRMPSGFRNYGWEVQISGQRDVYAFEMALSPVELRDQA